jgi:hypothetical protein
MTKVSDTSGSEADEYRQGAPLGGPGTRETQFSC